jgi:hypothetical protein
MLEAAHWAARKLGRNIQEVNDTGSMRPWLGRTCWLGIEPVSASDLHPGDAAVYQTSAGLVVHQVIEVRPDGILFGGINNTWNEGWISPDAVKWRVAAIFYFHP